MNKKLHLIISLIVFSLFCPSTLKAHSYLHYSNTYDNLFPNQTENIHDYTGKELDEDTGLHYYGARYYNAKLGRFMSVDPVGGNILDPQSFNRYPYVQNNPFKYTDPNGEYLETAWDAFNIGLGAYSLKQNLSGGNYIDALIDVGGIFVDTAATIAPFIPGGAGAAIKASRVARALDRVSPSQIKFSQPTISQNFSSSGTINETVAALRRGDITVDDIPAIRVVERNGELITLDNRRLAAFNAAGVKSIPIQRVSLTNPAVQREFRSKFNPVNGGQNIVITPNASGRNSAEEILRSFGKIE